MDIDVDLLIGGADREVSRAQREGQDVRVVRVAREFATSADDLWEALTSPERLPRWFIPIAGDLRVGGRFQLEGHAGGEVLECEPPRRFAVTWESGTQLSWLEVSLAPGDAGGTRLELSHTVPVDDHWEEYGPGAVGLGWDLGLMGLVLHVATGESVDAEAVMAWQTTPEAGDFMRRAAADWCRVQIDAGAPVKKAEGMRDRTLAAYTGS